MIDEPTIEPNDWEDKVGRSLAQKVQLYVLRSLCFRERHRLGELQDLMMKELEQTQTTPGVESIDFQSYEILLQSRYWSCTKTEIHVLAMRRLQYHEQEIREYILGCNQDPTALLQTLDKKEAAHRLQLSHSTIGGE